MGRSATFLLTDIEGSTRLWDEDHAGMRRSLELHDMLISSAVTDAGGRVVKPRGEGDSIFAVFKDPASAVAASVALQRRLAQARLPVGELKVRVAIHTGPAIVRDGDYYGPAVNRCARLRAAAHGGQVVLSEAAASQARTRLVESVDLVDLGKHQLRDLSEPEHIFQVVVPGLRERFPPLDTLGSHPHNLPVQISSFVGREAETADLPNSLEKSHLITLTGPGGVGKTRLALQAAALAADSFPAGTWLVELAPITDQGMVVRQVAGVLGVREEENRSTLETLIRDLRNRRLLLILDNCEHVLEQCAELAAAVLRQCPEVRVLATSREALGLPGERVHVVSPLSEQEAVSLFFERVELETLSAVPGKSAVELVGQVCRLTEGIALAVELASARARSMPLGDLVSRLNDRLGLLQGPGRGVPARHRGLRATLDWSHSLLLPNEQVLLRRLALFAGPFELPAVRAVCAGTPITADMVMDLLAHLCDKSLVQLRRDGRYSLLQTIRAYARDRLDEANEGQVVAERQVLHFERAAAEALRGPTDDRGGQLERLQGDLDNFRGVLSGLLERDPVRGLKLAVALGSFWSIRSHFAEGLAWVQSFVDRLPADSPERPAGLEEAASLAFQQGMYGTAVDLAEEALVGLELLGDQRGIRRALNIVALVASFRGDYARAATLFERGLAIASSLNDELLVAATLFNMGVSAYASGDFDLSAQRYRASLARYRLVGDQHGIQIALSNLAFSLLRLDRRDEVPSLLDEAEPIARLAGPQSVASVIICQGDLLLLSGNREAACEHFRQALIIGRDIESPTVMVDALEYLAKALSETEPEHALELAGAARAVRSRAGMPAEGGIEPAALLTVPLDRARANLTVHVAEQAMKRGASGGIEGALKLLNIDVTKS